MTPAQAATELLESASPPWRAAFQLAWEASQAGTAPVGALVTDGSGTPVSWGRNRIFETASPPGQLANSHLAHAELNALAALPTGNYPEHTLYTTLEPCLLCTAAARYAHIGKVRYAARDPLWEGVRRLPELNAHVARRWPKWQGPMSGPLGAWALLIAIQGHLRVGPASVVIQAYEEALPQQLRLARQALAAGVQPTEAPLSEALAAVWHLLDPECSAAAT